MFHDIDGNSPIKAAQAMTPWWMQRIQDFDALEIQPCQTVGYTSRGREIVEPCAAHEASFWTVYGHYRPGGVDNGVEAFKDFETEVGAQRFHDRLIEIYPHLAGDRPQPRSKLKSECVL